MPRGEVEATEHRESHDHADYSRESVLALVQLGREDFHKDHFKEHPRGQGLDKCSDSNADFVADHETGD